MLLATELKNRDSVVIMGHKNLDGDALGALMAMGHFCRNEYGKEPMLTFEGVIPDNLRFLSSGWWLKKAEEIKDNVYDLAILLDTGNIQTQLGDDARQIFKNAKKTIKIDHHMESAHEADVNLIQMTAATCEIVANVALDVGWRITPQIARFLYVGIFTDTGGFIHNYMTAETTRTTAKLLEAGFDHAETVRRLFEKNRETFLNNAETLARTLFTDDGKIGYTTFSIKKTAEAERPHRETDWLHRQIMMVRDVAATVIFKETDDGTIQVSIRAKTKPIHAFAESLGGGGHKLAAGCVIEGAMAEVVQQIIPKFQAFLNGPKDAATENAGV